MALVPVALQTCAGGLFFYAAWRADQAFTKGGAHADLGTFTRWNGFAGASLHVVAALWGLALLVALCALLRIVPSGLRFPWAAILWMVIGFPLAFLVTFVVGLLA